MACINPDGMMEPVARAVLQALKTAHTPEDVAQRVALPLYRIRSGLRELVQAGLVVEAGGQYALTAAGQARIAARPGAAGFRAEGESSPLARLYLRDRQ